jgi:EAL and modified HD-GYP domain-containing signal transduction protein
MYRSHFWSISTVDVFADADHLDRQPVASVPPARSGTTLVISDAWNQSRPDQSQHSRVATFRPKVRRETRQPQAPCGVVVAPEGGQMDVLVGRQPILDRHNRTVAYELLFRSGTENRFDGSDGDAASTAVIANAFLTVGCNRVIGTKLGFINFTRALLVEGHAWMLPKDRVVVEILEDVEPDEQVIESVRKLREAGYSTALDDISTADELSPLLTYAVYAKLDWLALAARDRRRLCGLLHARGLRLLAEKVETKTDFESALANGCELFQGYYFARPEILSAREVPTSKLASLRLLHELQKPDLKFERLEELVRSDIGLTQKLLYFVNSAAFAHRRSIESLSQALIYLGEDNIRKWIPMAALPRVADGKPGELVTVSLTRARFCELAAEHSRLRSRRSSCFLVGLLSLLDAMVGRPLEELVENLGLEAHVANAILGKPGADDGLRSILQLAVALERSDFDAAAHFAAATGIAVARAGEMHVEAMTWSSALENACCRERP